MKTAPDESVDPAIWYRRHLPGRFILYQTLMGYQRLVFFAFPQPWAPYHGFKDKLASVQLDSHWSGLNSEIFTFNHHWARVWDRLCMLAPPLAPRPFPMDQVCYLEELPGFSFPMAKDASGMMLIQMTHAGFATAADMGVPVLIRGNHWKELADEVGDHRQP
jgi:hypothetical protein